MPFPISLSSAVGSPGVSPGGRSPPLVNKQVEMSDSTGVITHSAVFAVYSNTLVDDKMYRGINVID